LIDIDATISVPVTRDSRTSRANPIAASQAPIVSKRIHISPMFIEFHTSMVGTINTSLSIMPSSISSDINRCVCCIKKATNIITGTR
jgi:hypothetical protein